MKCGGSGKVQTYNAKHDDFDIADCPGCEECECEGCEGRGDLSIHGVDGQCGLCHGTGRKMSDERS